MTLPVKSGLVPSEKEAKRAQIIAELERRDLPEWAQLFCQWLAQHPTAKRKAQLETAELLAGWYIHWADLQELKRRSPFQAMLAKERTFLAELNATRESFIGNYPRAGKVWAKSWKALEEEIDGPDKLGAVRAATPLLQMVADRIHPKKEEKSGVEANVTVNLTVHQAASLHAPEIEVEAEEVPYEVIAEEVSEEGA